ncbi:hypothetical protein TRICI_005384 [Trichomonascus ciferrii]|uniref:Maltose/galactoside acetyltransferase domain-containing protein n=1 Tax=Trichomonascus ciferrii TaxID=44093 RepID=A0A642UST4_9ASCO|nr:hypothetical protein TRICI_005384 [Trichomonascus ciferrii]
MGGDRDIFERLRDGETIEGGDAQAGRMLAESYATKALVLQMNSTADPAEVRRLLGEITGKEVDESVHVFTPLYINYGKNTKIGKNVFINFDCVFLDLGGITIDDGVLIAPSEPTVRRTSSPSVGKNLPRSWPYPRQKGRLDRSQCYNLTRRNCR